MTCAKCNQWVPDMEHQFFEGNPERPKRRWAIIAPLYFKANETNTAAVEGYCSIECASRAYLTEQRQ